jgi:hypothetical protein
VNPNEIMRPIKSYKPFTLPTGRIAEVTAAVEEIGDLWWIAIEQVGDRQAALPPG